MFKYSVFDFYSDFNRKILGRKYSDRIINLWLVKVFQFLLSANILLLILYSAFLWYFEELNKFSIETYNKNIFIFFNIIIVLIFSFLLLIDIWKKTNYWIFIIYPIVFIVGVSMVYVFPVYIFLFVIIKIVLLFLLYIKLVFGVLGAVLSAHSRNPLKPNIDRENEEYYRNVQ